MKSLYKNINSFKFINKIKGAVLSFNKIEWKIFLIAIIVLFISTVILLEQINLSFMTTMPKTGGNLTEGIVGTPRFVNPVLASTDVDKDLINLIYSGLMRKDENGNLIP